MAPIILRDYPDRTLNPMSFPELKDRFPGLTGLTYKDGNQVLHFGDKLVEVSPMASFAEIEVAIQNPFVPTQNTKVTVSVASRLKEKALAARQVVPNAIKAFEADLDSILAEQPIIEQQRLAAVSAHKDAIAEVKAEQGDLKSAVDILSNGGPA